MVDTLEATLQGPSRSHLTERAKALAAAYFGTPCVVVILTAATVSGDADEPTFQASFAAQEHHDVQGRSYGPGICNGCKAEDWPQHPLTRAQAWPRASDGRGSEL